jgi:toxin HigB-1
MTIVALLAGNLIGESSVTADSERCPRWSSDRREKLRRDRAGQHSIRVNDQWRVCFVWRDGDAHDVMIVDYH